MQQHWKRLADGVELAAVQTGKFKTGVLSVALTWPLREETAAAGALVSGVLYRGSRKHPDMEKLSHAADALYGASLGTRTAKRGDSQCVKIVSSFIDDRYALDGSAVLEPAAALAGELLLDPATQDGVFRRDYVESERTNLTDAIQARVNDKRGWAIHRLIQEMFAGEVYAIDPLGSEERVRAITPESLWTQYQALLACARVSVCYGGSAGFDRVEDAVRQAFAPLLTGRTAPIHCQVRREPRGAVRRVEDAMDVTQGKLSMGFCTGGITCGSAQYPALAVFNAMYGGSANSRLFLNVREKLSLCYYASSSLDAVKGLMAVSSGVEFDQFDRAQEAILAQLDALRRGDFTQEELDAAKRMVGNQLRSLSGSQTGMAEDQLIRMLFHFEHTHEELIQAVEAMTADQIVAAANLVRLDTVYRLSGKEG